MAAPLGAEHMLGARRFWFGLMIGVLVGGLTGFASGKWQLGLLVVVLTTALIHVVWGLIVLWPLDGEQTRARATKEDLGGELGDLALVLILVASLASIAILLSSSNDSNKVLYASLALGAIAAAWGMLHSIFTARYARHYYRDQPGGIDFNTPEPPRYVDFYYFSFNLGMTYQVSDTSVSSSELRGAVLKHCLLSYAYGTGIIATTINLVINLVG